MYATFTNKFPMEQVFFLSVCPFKQHPIAIKFHHWAFSTTSLFTWNWPSSIVYISWGPWGIWPMLFTCETSPNEWYTSSKTYFDVYHFLITSSCQWYKTKIIFTQIISWIVTHEKITCSGRQSKQKQKSIIKRVTCIIKNLIISFCQWYLEESCVMGLSIYCYLEDLNI